MLKECISDSECRVGNWVRRTIQKTWQAELNLGLYSLTPSNRHTNQMGSPNLVLFVFVEPTQLSVMIASICHRDKQYTNWPGGIGSASPISALFEYEVYFISFFLVFARKLPSGSNYSHTVMSWIKITLMCSLHVSRFECGEFCSAWY